jgi:hypothetical protein
MQYRLRTLVLWTAVGPPVVATLWWVLQWMGSVPYRWLIPLMFAGMASWIVAPIVWYFELSSWVFGPSFLKYKPRKKRRRTRVRIERWAGGST